MQGGNQVLKYDYRILVSSYKTKPVKVQVWDRLPQAETETRQRDAASRRRRSCATTRCTCARRSRTTCCAGTSKVEPGMNGEKAVPINYEFKVELDKNMVIGGFLSK